MFSLHGSSIPSIITIAAVLGSALVILLRNLQRAINDQRTIVDTLKSEEIDGLKDKRVELETENAALKAENSALKRENKRLSSLIHQSLVKNKDAIIKEIKKNGN